jgi:L-malate glycosyltransferase
MMSTKRVIIAHQSTIPHYRVPFFQAVEQLRPSWWEFCVVYDPVEAHRTYQVESDEGRFDFPTLTYRTYVLSLGRRRILFQSFALWARPYDLIVVGGAMHNLAYPFSILWSFLGKSVAYWGHGRDVTAVRTSSAKRILENLKLSLYHRADGFFAYTQSVRDYLVSRGIDERKIFTLGNTIDINRQRHAFETHQPWRDTYRKRAGLDQNKVLLFVGRLNARKKLSFLIETFTYLKLRDASYYFVIVGGGDVSMIERLKATCGEASVSYHGVVDEHDIGYYYTLSDLFIFPGDVGLGPLQALCFDLIPVIIDSPTHSPEVEYLNQTNSLRLPPGTSPAEYADAIDRLLASPTTLQHLRAQAWPSIAHLTIEKMAQNFINGVNTILQRRVSNSNFEYSF